VQPQVAFDNSPIARLIGSSAGMKELHRLLLRMGHALFPVLILGETGTGKELVARAIHSVENRGPFVIIDCSSLVGPLMESELFGYSKGAFTGAHTSKLGLLDSANGGTAFFDEIGELPLDLQMKLLRVLQEKEFRAVGGLGQRYSNFRVIVATNRDLAAEVQAQRFRQDLFYRLNVMRLRIPPLRERKDDIPVLIAHFISVHGNGHRLTEEVMDSLVEYHWPGNVRELEHVLQQMIAMNSGPWLNGADLPSFVINRSLERNEGPDFHDSPSALSSLLPDGQSILPLAEVEKRAILEAIRYTKGDRTVTAALLGIGRTTLYRKLKEYGV
jgi:transcriptional regulator with PAS, ATPase and Fis domain